MSKLTDDLFCSYRGSEVDVDPGRLVIGFSSSISICAHASASLNPAPPGDPLPRLRETLDGTPATWLVFQDQA